MKVAYLILAIIAVLQLITIAGAAGAIAQAYAVWAKQIEKDANAGDDSGA